MMSRGAALNAAWCTTALNCASSCALRVKDVGRRVAKYSESRQKGAGGTDTT